VDPTPDSRRDPRDDPPTDSCGGTGRGHGFASRHERCPRRLEVDASPLRPLGPSGPAPTPRASTHRSAGCGRRSTSPFGDV
jgi:hypothetical protein